MLPAASTSQYQRALTLGMPYTRLPGSSGEPVGHLLLDHHQHRARVDGTACSRWRTTGTATL